MHNVKVFAVDKTVTRTETGEQTVLAKTISLLLTPKQADMVTLASEIGKIRLVMRGTNDEDDAPGEAGSAKIEDILGGKKLDEAPVPTVAAKPTTSVLDEINKHTSTVEPAPVVAPPPPNVFRMTIMEGTNVRIVELPADGSFSPETTSGSPAPSPLPAAEPPPASGPAPEPSSGGPTPGA